MREFVEVILESIELFTANRARYDNKSTNCPCSTSQMNFLRASSMNFLHQFPKKISDKNIPWKHRLKEYVLNPPQVRPTINLTIADDSVDDNRKINLFMHGKANNQQESSIYKHVASPLNIQP